MALAWTMAGARRLGGRMVNEDAIVVDAPRGIAIVADGAGGVCTGVVAAQLACHGLARLVAGEGGGEAGMREAFAAINALVFAAGRDDALPAGPLGEALYAAIDDEARAIVLAAREPKRMSLRGTMAAAVACVLRGDAAVIGHAGDARAYRLRDGAIERLTRDHDLAAEMPHLAEELPPHLARIVVRGIGLGEAIDPAVRTVALAAGDTIVLCTDGVHGAIDDDAIAAILTGTATAAARCEALLDRAIQGGGAYPDNAAAVVIELG